MKKKIVILLCGLWSCMAASQTTVFLDKNIVVSNGYIGNGVQWDPYQLDYGKGRVEISKSDWKKMYDRLDFMKPAFIRVMTNATSVINKGTFKPEQGFEHLSHILNYCQSRGVTVMFGDWGGSLVNGYKKEINKDNITFAAKYLEFLVKNNKYSCIKYYNLVNEPNGYWSSTDGDYSLWATAIRYFYNKIDELELTDKVKIVGPDAAIWTPQETWWVDSCATDLIKEVGLYDIHTYPSKITVNSGEYSKILSSYKECVPADKKIVMGEIGFKYEQPEDSLYKKENNIRAAAYPNASLKDSQMFVYDYMYGVDMADALIQSANTGYSGAVAWMLDDAMHCNEAPDKLKIWGFWNIFGDEIFGNKEEQIRPWFYAWSLLTRYMPKDSKILGCDVTGSKDIKSVLIENKGKYMLALVNVGNKQENVVVKSTSLTTMKGVKSFVYAENKLIKKGECMLSPVTRNKKLDFISGYEMAMPSQTLVVLTNFKY